MKAGLAVKPFYLYVLELVGGRFYVGTSQSPEERIAAHKRGDGSRWTQVHRPIEKAEKKYPRKKLTCSDDDVRLEEDAMVKKVMKKEGIENVRGGTYGQVNLSHETFSLLQRELDHASNACLRCGRLGHWVENCFARTHINGNQIFDSDDESEESELYHYKGGKGGYTKGGKGGYAKGGKGRFQPYDACFRCGRTSHFASECVATTNWYGDRI